MQIHSEGQLDYLAQIKRTAKNVAQWERGLQWGEYTLQPYVRGSEWHWMPAQRHRLALAQTITTISGVPQPVPTLLIIDLDKVDAPDPKTKYAAAFATTLDDPLWIQADLYAWRQDHELAFQDCIHALGLDAKPKGYRKAQPNLPLDNPDQTTALITCLTLPPAGLSSPLSESSSVALVYCKSKTIAYGSSLTPSQVTKS